MKIDLGTKIAEHFMRLEELAKEAAEDGEESYSSRASAMTALSRMLTELTTAQEKVVNMERLMKIESTTIEVLAEYLNIKQQEKFIASLEERLNAKMD